VLYTTAKNCVGLALADSADQEMDILQSCATATFLAQASVV
jgi:hypothetical protein